MIDIKSFREAIKEVVSTIPEINKTRFVVTDDELATGLSRHKITDNTLLMCLIPTYANSGEKDKIKMTSYFQFFILNKVDYKELENEEAYLSVFIDTQKIVSAFLKALFNYQRGECHLFNGILEESVLIRPVRNKAECNGWEIQIDCEDYGFNF